jgi:hypothetical protein
MGSLTRNRCKQNTVHLNHLKPYSLPTQINSETKPDSYSLSGTEEIAE